MTTFMMQSTILDPESSAYLTPISGGSDPVIPCITRSPEPCDSDIDNYTTSNSLGGGSYVAGDTLLPPFDRRLLL